MSLAERLPDFTDDVEDDDGPAYELRRRPALACPVVFSSPHSGRVYPERMMALSRLDARAVRLSEDAYVDGLIAPAEGYGVALMLARYGRAYVDLNREPTELDPEMFEGGAAAAPAARTARVAAGLGCIARVVAQGREIYRGKLPAGEAERRIAQAWRPYHAGLDALLNEARARFGRALLIDWHSMPGAAARADRARTGRTPDIVLGDRFGAACAPAITAAVQRELEAAGYVVVRNTPYAGGWTTERYGRPAAGVHALQIEIRRALYLDEARLAPSRGFEPLRRDIARLAARLASLGREFG